LELEKARLSEKWIRLSAKQRVDEKARSKTRFKEEELDKAKGQLDVLNQK